MTPPPATARLGITQGAAMACFVLAGLVSGDHGDTKELFHSFAALWRELDLELNHPIEAPCHVAD